MTLFKAEELHPAADRLRHAQTLAAIYQGASTRRSRKAWSAADFLPADPWAPAPKRRPRSAARSDAARMATLVASFRR